MLDPKDWATWISEIEGYVDPKGDFIGWLGGREVAICKALEDFKLPVPNRLVAYDRSEPSSWRYGDYEGKPGEYNARTEWYLQRSFPTQSHFWYLGRILSLIHECRIAIQRESWLELAGVALEMGRVDEEMRLKFFGRETLACIRGPAGCWVKQGER